MSFSGEAHSPEGGAKGNIAHEDDIQQDEGGGEEPVNIAGVVDAAQVAVWVCNVHAATMSTLQENNAIFANGSAEMKGLPLLWLGRLMPGNAHVQYRSKAQGCSL